MNAELRIHFTDHERKQICAAIQAATKAATPIASSVRAEIGLKEWDHERIDRMFQEAPEAGYSKSVICATDRLLEDACKHITYRMEEPGSFVFGDDEIAKFIDVAKKQISDVKTVRHLLANAVTVFHLFEE